MTALRNWRCSTWSADSTATRSRPTKRAVPATISTPRSSVRHPVAQPVDDAVLPALGGREIDVDAADEPGPAD